MASVPVRELFIKWGFEVDDKPLEDLEKGIDNIKSGFKAVGVLAAASGAALFGLAKSTALTGERLKLTSDRLGVNTDELQKLEFAAEQAGASADQVTGSLQSLAIMVGNARKGVGGGIEAFQNLAIASGRQIDLNASLEEQFLQIGDAINSVQSKQLQLALSSELLGDGQGNLIPLFKNGRAGVQAFGNELVALGGIIDKEAIERSAEFERQWKKITTLFNVIKVTVGQEILQPLIETFEDLIQAFKENREEIQETLIKGIEAVILLFKEMWGIIKTGIKVLTGFTRALGGPERAIRLLTLAFSTFLGLKILFGLGQLVKGFALFTSGLNIAGNTALIAQAKLMAIPLAIGAIIAAIALLVEDFIVFQEGGDSVIGLMVNALDELFGSIEDRFGVFGTIIQSIITVLLTPIRALVNAFKTIKDGLDVITGNRKFIDFLKATAGRIGNTLGIGVTTGSSALGIDTGALEGITNPKAGSVGSTSNTRNVSINAPVTANVTVPPNTPPGMVAPAITEGIAEAISGMLRETDRATTPAVER